MKRVLVVAMPLSLAFASAVGPALAEPAPNPSARGAAEAAKQRREEARAAAKERREDKREALKERREEIRGTLKERREEMRKALLERREEMRGALKERREEMRQSAKEWREEFRKARRTRTDEIREAAEEYRKNAEEGLKKLRARRAARRAIQRARFRRAWGQAALKLEPVQAELKLHGWRMARLNRIRFLAEAKKNDKLLAKVDTLTEKEVARHEARMEELTKESDVGKPASSAEPPAAASAQEGE